MPRITDSYDEDSNRNMTQDLLWAERIKATAPRRALIDLLLYEPHPLSITEISKKLPEYDSSSLYRALELFVEKDLAHKVNIGKNHAVFELLAGRKHHHHLICTSCGYIEDSEKCLPEDLERGVLSKSRKFSSLSRHSLEFFGLCNDCEKKHTTTKQ